MASGLPTIAAAMDLQQTLRHPVKLAGIGLHSGEPVEMTVSPAGADTGHPLPRRRRHADPGNADHVVDTNSATTVGPSGCGCERSSTSWRRPPRSASTTRWSTSTGPEVPAADGSAKPFLELLR